MDDRDMRIHSDDQVAHRLNHLPVSQSRSCEEQTQVNEQKLGAAPPCSDSDQFLRDELSASDKLNIGSNPNLRGFPRRPSPFEGGDDGACDYSRNGVNPGHGEDLVMVNCSQGQGREQATQAPENARESALITLNHCSAPNSTSDCIEYLETTSAQCQGDQPAPRGVGTLYHTVSPAIKTMASRATSRSKRDSATANESVRQNTVDLSHSLRSRSQSAENKPFLLPPAVLHTSTFVHSDGRDEDAELSQPNICVAIAALNSDNEHIAKTPPCKISLQTVHMPVETATKAEQGAENSSLSIVNSSLVETKVHVSSTPPMPRSEPILASPVRIGAEAMVQSTPPSSPMKLSSPPSLKPAQKVDRTHAKGLGAPFRNPWPGPVRYGLPTMMPPLPPSSPPPMVLSSPPAKRSRVDSDSEDQPRPKARRTNQLVSSPFVSPLRNAQGARTRPPAGGFSTPLRSSTVHYENFSSPILPSQPDVFTTLATAARSSPAYRPATTLSSPATSASTSYKLRPPRTVTRPFKPPAKSNRPTTATAQALRQRLQLLRNALRVRGLEDPTRPTAPTQSVKTACNDEELEALALRWRAAAQEAAQDLWALVRDSIGTDSWGSDSGGGSKPDGWGWSDKPTRLDNANTEKQGLDDVGSSGMFTPPPVDKLHRSLLKNLNRPVVPRKTLLPPYEIDTVFAPAEIKDLVEDTEPEKDKPKYHTLGTLLTSLGIPHEVLGWQEEEGEFVN
ncbi:hypothetical protein RSOLAG22IIIB_03793 [Rhizoctonia solani]|uniref:Uncharacterized protein n=1 Tax=Rhizoctonia solani TaxID=456999 RepID=A0A0K6FS70_9AGAM|nr:hypothetical protein RSOLAG22IIIB_03793 [Rhizoctonia solani]